MLVEQNGWVKFHRRALRPDGSLMQLSISARGIFLCYVALARWEEPYCGCICDPDGRAWSRDERAEAIGVSYNTAHKAEAAMVEEDLIIIDKRGKTRQRHSQGRLRIINYEHYQVGHEAEVVPSKKEEQLVPDETADPDDIVPSKTEEPAIVPSEEEEHVPSKKEEPSSGIEGTVPSKGEEETPPHNDNGSKKDVRSKGLKGLAAIAAGNENPDDKLSQATLFATPASEKPKRLNVEKPPPEREPTELTGAHALALIEQYPTEHDDLIVIRECWEAFGFDGAPSGHGYSGLRELVQTFGYVHYQAWAAHIRTTKPRQPAGTKPWKFFAKEFRRAASRDFDWAPQKAGSRPSGRQPSGKGVADVGNHESGEVVWDNEGNPIGRRPA